MKNTPLGIRALSKSDLPKLSELAARSFVETYAGQDPMEELTAYCQKNLSETAFSAAMDEPSCAFFGAFDGPEPVGYLQLRFGQNERGEAAPADCWLHRIYLDRRAIGTGAGRLLMNFAAEKARERGCRRLWLVVYSKNERAIAFYRKCGMRQVGTFDFDFNGTIHVDPIFEMDV